MKKQILLFYLVAVTHLYNMYGMGKDSQIHDAAEWGLTGRMAHLLANSTDPKQAANKRDEYGCTPLHWATCCSGGIYTSLHDWGSPKQVAALLKLGSDPNAQNLRLNTPLHMSICTAKNCWSYNPDVIKLLLDAGANPTIENDEGKTPLEKFKELYDRGVVKQDLMDLMQKCADKYEAK